MDIELRLREIMTAEDPGVQVTDAVMSRVGGQYVPSHSGARVYSISKGRALRSRFVVVGAFVTVAAAAGMLVQHGGWASKALLPGAVTSAAPAPGLVTTSATEARSDIERSISSSLAAQAPAIVEQKEKPNAASIAVAPSATMDAINEVGHRQDAVPGKGVSQKGRTVAALPGIEGYELDLGLMGGVNAAALAAQSRDPIWAGETEERIHSELQRRGLKLSKNKIVCRMSSCGILLVASEVDDFAQMDVKELKTSLKKLFGFQGSGSTTTPSSDGSRFTFVSLMYAMDREQYWLVPSPQIPALPGMSGYEIAVLGSTFGGVIQHPAEVLAAESSRSTAWSSTMETSVYQQALSIAGGRINQIQVKCAVTTCGIVLDFPRGTAPENTGEIGDQIAKSVGLTNVAAERHANSAVDFVTIYLRRR